MSRSAYIPSLRCIFAKSFTSFSALSWPASGRVVTSIVGSPFPPPGRGTVREDRTMVELTTQANASQKRALDLLKDIAAM